MGKLDEFKTKHDPKTIIARLEAELKRATQESADADAIKALIGTAVQKLDAYTPPEWIESPLDPSSPGVPTLFLSDLHWGEVVRASQIGGVNQ